MSRIITPSLIEENMRIYDEYMANSSNPKFHRTKEESSLCDDFFLNHQAKIKFYERKIYNNFKGFEKTLPVVMRINSLKKSIKAYYQFKEYCYQTPGGCIYFQNMWEYCHNSKKECFTYVDTLQELLTYLEENKELIIDKEQKLPVLESDLMDFIEKNNGILQRDIYKQLYSKYNPFLRCEIQKILRDWENDCIVERKKHKSTYQIYLLV